MATITYFTDKSGAAFPKPSDHFVVSQKIDFSEKSAAASDVVQAVKIKAGTVVQHVAVYVETAEGGACTADIGDGTDPNGWNDAVDFNATGLSSTASGTDALADSLAPGEGKFYSADDTIDITLDNAADAAVVHVIVRGYLITASL